MQCSFEKISNLEEMFCDWKFTEGIDADCEVVVALY